MQDLFHEECYVLLMEPACRILDKVLVSKGGLTETAVDIRLICAKPCCAVRLSSRFAITTRRAGAPSMEDDRLTTGSRRLAG